MKPADEKEEKIVIAEPESNVKLECFADGYPLTADTIKWKNIPNRAEVIVSNNGKSILSVKNVSKEISGPLTCSADNGVGSSDTWKIILLVKCMYFSKCIVSRYYILILYKNSLLFV